MCLEQIHTRAAHSSHKRKTNEWQRLSVSLWSLVWCESESVWRTYCRKYRKFCSENGNSCWWWANYVTFVCKLFVAGTHTHPPTPIGSNVCRSVNTFSENRWISLLLSPLAPPPPIHVQCVGFETELIHSQVDRFRSTESAIAKYRIDDKQNK